MELFNADQQPNLGQLAGELKAKIDSDQAVIGVVGLGYVGLPIALEYAKKGIAVVGVDVDSRKIDENAPHSADPP